jgi:hypothetical protein
MRLYIAGPFTSGCHKESLTYQKCSQRGRDILDNMPHVLESFHYIASPTHPDRIRRLGKKIFLDSGAFSAWSQGVTIDLEAYCRYVKKNADVFEVASVLDVIGDAEGTWQNQLRCDAMDTGGVPILPCFHYGEDPKYLKRYLDNYEYITIGGLVGKPRNDVVRWLDRIWGNYLTDSSGAPTHKVHGFGMTGLTVIQRYPWYSVDSSSWIQKASRGTITHPLLGSVSVSLRSPHAKDEGQSFHSLSSIEQARWLEAIAESGLDAECILYSLTVPYERWVFNIWAYQEIGRRNIGLTTHFKVINMELF